MCNCVFGIDCCSFFVRQALCEEWAKKPAAEQDFGAFHRAVSAAAYHQSGRLKYRVHMLHAVSCVVA